MNVYTDVAIPVVVTLFICVVLINLIFDFLCSISYRWCRKKEAGKPCRIWSCKNYDKCMQIKDIKHGLLILDSSYFKLVLEDGRRVPVPCWIPEDAFPVVFTNGDTELEFRNIEHLEEFSLLIYDRLYRKPNKLKQRTK